MVNDIKKNVKFEDLKFKGKMNCILQYMYIICAYEEFEDDAWTVDLIGEDIDLFVEATPGQFWFDENGDWYDEGRMVK